MPYFCAVKGCPNNYTRTKANAEIVYHTFPKDVNRFVDWIHFCGRGESWKPQKNQGICSQHFSASSYDHLCQLRHEVIGAKKRRQLLTTAIPELRPPENLSPADGFGFETHASSVDVDDTYGTVEEEVVNILEEVKEEPEDTDTYLKEEPVDYPLPQIEVVANPLDVEIPPESQTVNQFCRLCLRELPNLFPLMSRIQDVMIPEMVATVTGVNINFRDKLPKKVCITCLTKLDYAYNIRTEFLENHKILKNFAQSRLCSLVDNLNNYQKGVRVTTETYAEKLLRQNRDILRMRLIKKQEYLSSLTGEEVIEKLDETLPVEKILTAVAEKSVHVGPKVNPMQSLDFEEDYTEFLEEEFIQESHGSVNNESIAEQIVKREEKDYPMLEIEVLEEDEIDEASPQPTVEPKVKKVKKPHPRVAYPEKRKTMNQYNVKSKEAKPDPNKCYICEEVCGSVDDLNIHLPTHVAMIPYTCEQCDSEGGQAKKFTSLILLHRHFRMHAGPIKCPQCPHRVWSATGLYAHMSQLHKEGSTSEYTCEFCGIKMQNKRPFDKHIRSHKAVNEGRYTCSVCQKRFSTKTRLTRHGRSHTNERPYQCKYCDKTFTTETTRNGHERTHTGEKGFRCDICGQSYRMKHTLHDHMAVAHNQGTSGTTRETYSKHQCFPQPVECAVDGCDFVTSIRAYYYSHKAKHDLKFHCPDCPKRFPTKQRLEMHEYVHTGIKKHNCEECGKSFRYQGVYREHMNRHKNIRPFTCEFCGMSFVSDRHLREHRLKHSDTLTYECRHCGKKFRYRADLSKHERVCVNSVTEQAEDCENPENTDMISESIDID